MELTLNIEQLKLKSEYLYTNPRCTYYHEDVTNPLFVSWDGCVTVLYSLDNLAEASTWNPVEPIILSTSNPIIALVTFDSNIYCVDNIGSIHILVQAERDSPDIFDCSLSSHISQQPLSNYYEWKTLYSQKCPCDVLEATHYSNGIALVIKLDDWITIQLLQISISANNKISILNTSNKPVRSQKQFPFVATSFISCIWRDWFSSKRAKELFGPTVLDSQDVFILATEESKIYCTTTNLNCKNVSLFLNCPQKIIHIQFCDFESKKLILVSSSGILSVMYCSDNIPSSLIYLPVTKVDTVFIVDYTVIVSDGINLFQITLDKQLSKIVKQVVTSLKGVLTLQKFKFVNIIAMTQLNKVYKLCPKYKVSTQEEFKFKFEEKCVLENINNLCTSIETLEEQQEKLNKYIHAVSLAARKDLITQNCSLSVLIYSGAKAVKLGALQGEHIIAIKLSTDCPLFSFSSSVWQLLVHVKDSKNESSNCSLHAFNTDLFNNNHSLIIKHHILDAFAEKCAFGSVYCEFVCQIKNEMINRCLVIPLSSIKLNSLYFVKAKKRESISEANPFEYQHKYVFKYPENLSLVDCLTVLTNKNKHNTSKLLHTNITDNTPKTLHLDFFGKIVSIILDDTITKTIVIECADKNTLIAVRDGVIYELSNDQPVTINYSVLADIQKQLCLIEKLSVKNQYDNIIVNEIKTKIINQISTKLPL